MKLQIQKLHQDAKIPHSPLPGDAGFDMAAAETVVIPSGGRRAVPTGIALAIPEGYVGLVWDKSGRALNDGLKTMAGVIDSGYRGEVKIVVLNTTNEDITIESGDKVAQLLVQHVLSPEIVEVDELPSTERGESGFGSTGLSM